MKCTRRTTPPIPFGQFLVLLLDNSMKERDGKGDGQTEEEGLNQTESVCPVSKNVEKGNGNSTSS